MTNWRPTASLALLQKRADLLKKIRRFFHDRHVLEVETPILAASTIPDPHIASLKTQLNHENYYLQTSPEFHMKRLLAAGCPSIFQISKAFRTDESGQFHNPEFTLLEWYRLDFDAKQLMDEVDLLLNTLLHTHPAKRISYQTAFQTYLNIDPLNASSKTLAALAKENNIHLHANTAMDKDDWLNLLMSSCIEPKLSEPQQPYFIFDFPISQAALAKQSLDDPRVAKRFEVYMHGIELANGFQELTDAKEQRQRFDDYLSQRKKSGFEAVSMPEKFLAALEHGLPECAGIALGIDRLLMLYCKLSHIQDVISFPSGRA